MRAQQGSTLFELLAVMAIAGILAAIVVPAAGTARRQLAGAAGAHELALVLRAAQARAQARATTVRVDVASDGAYTVRDMRGTGSQQTAVTVARGELGVAVESNYPGGCVAFGGSGYPGLPGATSPRAGSFIVAGDRRVVVQLGGCVRCI